MPRFERPAGTCMNVGAWELCSSPMSKAHLLGIFTGRDAVRILAQESEAATLPLRRVMTKEPACLPPRHKAIEALRLMRDGGFRHVPVVENGVLIGVVSRGDFRGLEQDRLDEETGLWERMR